MATNKEVREEREAPTVTVELTARELHRAMESATAEKVACDRASEQALTSIGEAAVYTLAEKLQAAWKETPDAKG